MKLQVSEKDTRFLPDKVFDFLKSLAEKYPKKNRGRKMTAAEVRAALSQFGDPPLAEATVKSYVSEFMSWYRRDHKGENAFVTKGGFSAANRTYRQEILQKALSGGFDSEAAEEEQEEDEAPDEEDEGDDEESEEDEDAEEEDGDDEAENDADQEDADDSEDEDDEDEYDF